MSEIKNMNEIDIIKDRVKQKKQKRFLLIANGLIVGILVLWLTVGNLLATNLEQPMIKAQEEFLQRYPKKEANDSAIRLIEFTRKLEFYKSGVEYEKTIGYAFGEYINQLKTSNSKINPIPEDIKSYLTSKSTIIEEIITILKNTPPSFENIDLSVAFTDPINYTNTALPGFLDWSTIKRLLLVKAIQHYQTGQIQKVLDILIASRNINLALQEQGSLIGQLVDLILFTDQLAFLRKTSLPIEVLQSTKPNYPKLIFPAIEFENLFMGKFLQIASSEFSQKVDSFTIEKRSPLLYEKVLLPFQRPYLKLSGIDYWHKNMKMLERIKNLDNICLFDRDTISKETKATLAWWNVIGRSQEIYLTQMFKPYRRLLEWEFTQKILISKNNTAKKTVFPLNSQITEYSTICKTVQYDYRVTDNGQKMTIEMQNLPKWAEYEEGDLPVTFGFTINSNKTPV